MSATKPLPDGWRAVRLSGVCQLNPSRPPNLFRGDLEPVTFVPMQAIDETEGTIARPELRPFRDVRKGYTYFAENDVLFAKITPCMQNGKHALARALLGGFGFGTTEFHVLRPSPAITPEWIHFFIRQPEVLENAKAYFTGAVGQQRVPESYLASLEIPLPPLAEQKRIAAILNEQIAAVERARAAANAQLEAANALPAAYLRAVFESTEAQQWPRLTLCSLCRKITDGTHQPPPFTREGVPFLFVRILVGGRIDFNVSQYVSEDTFERLVERCRPEQGDVLYTAVGSFGVAVVVDTDRRFTFQRHIAHLKLRPEVIDSGFLVAYINSPSGRAESDKAALGGAQRTVTLGALSHFQIPTPPLCEQRRVIAKVAERIADAERACTAIASGLDAIDKLPTALLRRAFNGEL